MAMIFGRSPAMRELRRLSDRVGRTWTSVLVLGETGTGKEELARHLHASGPTRKGPFVAVNCAAIPADLIESTLFGHEKGAFTGAHRSAKGSFRAADGGTLFLDEVGELTAPAQAKLLRVLQERLVEPVGGTPVPVRIRVVAATHRDLSREAESGLFRSDLWFRLSVVVLTVPPLRERLQDLGELVPHLLAKVADRLGEPVPAMAKDLLPALAGYGWPGNVRELENLLESTLVLSDRGEEPLSARHLPRDFMKRAFLELFDADAGIEADPGPEVAALPGRPAGPPVPPHPGPEGEPASLSGERLDLRAEVDRFERRLLVEALERHAWRKGVAARSLGLSARAMSYYLRKHRLEPPEG